MVEKIKANQKLAIIVAVVIVLLGGFFYMRSKQVDHVIKNGMYKMTISAFGQHEQEPGGIIFDNQKHVVSTDNDDEFKKVVANPSLVKTLIKGDTATYSATKDTLSFVENGETVNFIDLKTKGKDTITGKMKSGGLSINVTFNRVGEVK